MLAVDTNIIVRYLTADDPEQSRKARTLVDSSDVYASRTVLLESEWVLRSAYSFRPAQICSALRAFAGLDRVSVETPAVVAQALDLAEQGMDFADALHLAAAGDCEAMLTFDIDYIKQARRLGIDSVRKP